MRGRWLVAAGMALLPVVPGVAHASVFSVVLKVGSGLVQAHTRIGSECHAFVLYDNSAKPSEIGKGQHVGGSGIVQWAWSPRKNGVVSVACGYKSDVALGQQRVHVTAVKPPVPTQQSTGGATSSDAPGVVITASNLHVDNGGDSPPPSGQQFVVVRVTITNNGTSNYDYNGLDYTLEDGGDHVSHDSGAFDLNVSSTEISTGTLAPGQSTTGDLAFQVPASETEFILWWEPTFDSPKVPVHIAG